MQTKSKDRCEGTDNVYARINAHLLSATPSGPQIWRHAGLILAPHHLANPAV
jgi:hypothetical protein